MILLREDFIDPIAAENLKQRKGWQMRICDEDTGRKFQGLINDVLSHPAPNGEEIVILFAWILEDLGDGRWKPALEDTGEPVEHWVGSFQPWEQLEQVNEGTLVVCSAALRQTLAFFAPGNPAFELAARRFALLAEDLVSA